EPIRPLTCRSQPLCDPVLVAPRAAPTPRARSVGMASIEYVSGIAPSIDGGRERRRNFVASCGSFRQQKAMRGAAGREAARAAQWKLALTLGHLDTTDLTHVGKRPRPARGRY